MRRGGNNIRRALLFGTALVVVTIALAWSQRRPIAAAALDRALTARGVHASYKITAIGFRTQRIENLRLGDATHPDLTAARVDVSLVPSWGGIAVAALDARGVRLRGRIAGGRVGWGELDKLMPASTGKAFMLPAIDVRLADAHVALTTDIGSFDADIAGAGKLRDGFDGHLRVTSLSAGRAGCRLERPMVIGRVTIIRRQPHIAGLLAAGPSRCATVETGPLRIPFAVALGETLDRWTGHARIATAGLRQGALQLAAADARLAFAGSAVATNGTFELSSPAARLGGTRLAGLTANGRFGAGRVTTTDGRVKVQCAIADPALVARLRRALAVSVATPFGPLADLFTQAVSRAGEGATVDASFAYRAAGTRITAMRLAAKSGARLALPAIILDRRGFALDGDFALAGGGFPSIQGHVTSDADGSGRGLLEMAPYRAGNAQLVLQPVRLSSRRNGSLRIATVAMLDGPLGNGRAEGLRVPLNIQWAASGDMLVGPGCMPIAYRRIAVAGTVLAPGSVTLCPTQGSALLERARGKLRGGGRTGPLRLAGQVGDQALLVTVAGAAFALGGPLSASDLTAQLGSPGRRTRLHIARLDGSIGGHELAGRFAGLSGNIAQAPLLASAGQGRWRLRGGMLDVDGSMVIADQAPAPRFNPLSARNIELRVRDGRIAARGTLFEPVSSRAVTTVTIDHDLSRGTGDARLSVDALNFSKSLQPEAITPLTTGVVADVYGQIDGAGIIRWKGDKVTSSGRFRTEGLDFAAAFGPVSGASGEIEFDDLVALSTPSGQRVKLALVNPGVEVKDGTIAYRLRPNQVVDIEGGRWPFAGGDLLLEPGTLDLGRSTPRRLSFRVEALDAAKFIEQLKLENISATGTFDGTLPIVFDTTGGEIVGGQIVARKGGGTLAYVGDVSNAKTNMFAKLAFDALKSIRYGNLVIDLDGSLDGEIVSLVRFDGVNQSPVAPSGLAKTFTNLPFKFNIRVRAPFRGLVNTARSYQDPGLLLNRTVQPVAIDKRP